MNASHDRRKGFATAVFSALVVLALAFVVSALLVRNSGFENAQLQARLVFERFEDAWDFANLTQEDAIVDAAFSLACDSADFCSAYSTKASSYWNNAAGVLNDSVAIVSFSPEFSCSGTNNPFNAVASGVLNASSKNVFKVGRVVIQKTVSVEKTVNQVSGKTSVVVGVSETGTRFSYDCP